MNEVAPTVQTGQNLVICCDGTNNQFGSNNTNVVRLVQVLERNPAKQRLFYDAGVGTLPEPTSWGWLKKVWFDLCDLAFAMGLPAAVMMPPQVQPWADKVHESLDWKWVGAEIMPKFPYSAATQSHQFYINLGRRRHIAPGSLIHKTALNRMMTPNLNYSPPNLPESFRSNSLSGTSEFIPL